MNYAEKNFSKYLGDPGGTFDIDSLSTLLNVKSSIFSSVSPVQLTGTKTPKASSVIGTNIFNLHCKRRTKLATYPCQDLTIHIHKLKSDSKHACASLQSGVEEQGNIIFIPKKVNADIYSRIKACMFNKLRFGHSKRCRHPIQKLDICSPI